MNLKRKCGFNRTGQQPTLLSFTVDFERNVPRSSDLFAWWRRLARPVTWFDPVWFFLWRYLKAKVYSRRPGTIEQLKEPILQEVAAIPPAMTRKAMDNFVNGFKIVSSITAATWAMLSLKVFEKMASYVLFINKRIFCVPCFVWFLLPFKMWELFLPHPVYETYSVWTL